MSDEPETGETQTDEELDAEITEEQYLADLAASDEVDDNDPNSESDEKNHRHD